MNSLRNSKLTNFLTASVFSFAIYLVLTIGSGNILYWSKEEIALGITLSIITGLITSIVFAILKVNLDLKFLNPWRWLLFLAYALGPFLFSLTKANFEVAYRVITGKIKPGIVKISPKLKTNFGITLLADSISLTPGTLSVDIDKQNNLYIHWLWVKNKEPKIEQVAGNFEKWIKMITE